MKKGIYFVSGIDTGIGKSYATGHLARLVAQQQGAGSVITMKMVETGMVDGRSEDIALHRKLMGIGEVEIDRLGLSAPQLFATACSPHLAAQLEGKEVDITAIEGAISAVVQRYDVVLVEGAGGLMVPLTRELLTIDFVAQKGYEVVLVTSPRLGSLNHTLLSIEALFSRDIKLHTLVYNLFEQSSAHITSDTLGYLTSYLSTHSPSTEILTIGELL